MSDMNELKARLQHTFWEVSDLNRHIVNGAGIQTKVRIEDGLMVVYARLTETAEIANRRKVADIISDYRSILNSLAFSLVERGPSRFSPNRSPDFPAYSAKYSSSSKAFFANISPEDAALVPLCEGTDNIIVQLAERDNQRKHRRLTVITAVQTGVSFGGVVTVENPSSAQPTLSPLWTPVMSGRSLDNHVRPRVTLRFSDPFGPHDVNVTERLELLRMSVENVIRRFGAVGH